MKKCERKLMLHTCHNASSVNDQIPVLGFLEKLRNNFYVLKVFIYLKVVATNFILNASSEFHLHPAPFKNLVIEVGI